MQQPTFLVSDIWYPQLTQNEEIKIFSSFGNLSTYKHSILNLLITFHQAEQSTIRGEKLPFGLSLSEQETHIIYLPANTEI